MDRLPTELLKLCRLASMAECGDHLWENVPTARGLWSGLRAMLARRGRAWVGISGRAFQSVTRENLQPGL